MPQPGLELQKDLGDKVQTIVLSGDLCSLWSKAKQRTASRISERETHTLFVLSKYDKVKGEKAKKKMSRRVDANIPTWSLTLKASVQGAYCVTDGVLIFRGAHCQKNLSSH